MLEPTSFHDISALLYHPKKIPVQVMISIYASQLRIIQIYDEFFSDAREKMCSQIYIL